MPKPEAFPVRGGKFIFVGNSDETRTLIGKKAQTPDAKKMTIAPGKLADFVVLGDDPHTVDNGKLKDIEIVRTVKGGSTVYER